jgi:hypothetical protein
MKSEKQIEAYLGLCKMCIAFCFAIFLPITGFIVNGFLVGNRQKLLLITSVTLDFIAVISAVIIFIYCINLCKKL